VPSRTQPSRHGLLGYPKSLLFPSTFLLLSTWSRFAWSSDFTSVRDIVVSVLAWKLVFVVLLNLVSVLVRHSRGKGRPGATSGRESHELFFVWLYLGGTFFLFMVSTLLRLIWTFRFILLTLLVRFSTCIAPLGVQSVSLSVACYLLVQLYMLLLPLAQYSLFFLYVF
jgi:hypothetical protein